VDLQFLIVAALAALLVVILFERFRGHPAPAPAVEVLPSHPIYSDPVADVAELLDSRVKYRRAQHWLDTGVRSLADNDTQTIARGYGQLVGQPIESAGPIEAIPLAGPAPKRSARAKK